MKKIDTGKGGVKEREKSVHTNIHMRRKREKVRERYIQRKIEQKREKQGMYVYKKIAKERNIIEKLRCGKKVQIKRERKRKCKQEVGRYRRQIYTGSCIRKITKREKEEEKNEREKEKKIHGKGARITKNVQRLRN